jgi:hypothetical protein
VNSAEQMSSADQLHVLYLAPVLHSSFFTRLFLNFEKVIPLKSAVCRMSFIMLSVVTNVVARTHYVLLFYIIM